jgi:cytochrome bd-type quinol oxidase subunit 2
MGSMNHGEKIAPVAAATTALATLVCCLPVGIAAAAATASLAAVVSTYRVWFLVASGGLLALGIVQLARAQRQCATRKRGSVAILAVSATIVLLVALFPQVLAAVIAEWLP